MISVSGSGIAGLATALAVLRADHPLTMITGKQPLPPLLGGLQLAPNGWRALDHLGVAQAVRAHATTLSEINLRDLATGATLTVLNLAGPYTSIARADLARILSNAITDIASAPSLAANITHAVQHNRQQGGGLTLVLDSKLGTKLAPMKSDALIAADGITGFGRNYVNSVDTNQPQPAKGRVAMRAVVDAQNLPRLFCQPHSNLWLGANAHIVHYPLQAGKLVNIVVTLDHSLADSDWQRRVLGQNSITAHLADNPAITWAKTRLPMQSFETCWRRGRVVLAGDAAHPMPPNLAQGAGQSLEDATVLMQWLQAENIIDASLSGYARDRAAKAGNVFKKAQTSSKIMALGAPFSNLRNAALGFGGSDLLNSWLAEVWTA